MILRFVRKSWNAFSNTNFKSDIYLRDIFFTHKKFIKGFFRKFQHSLNSKAMQATLNSRKREVITSAAFAPVGFVKAEISKVDAEKEKLYDLQEKLASKFISTKELKDAIKILAQISSNEGADCENGNTEWSLVMNKENIKVWKKCFPNSSVCHYRCYGKVPDVAACAFFKVQFEDQLKKSADRAIKVLQTSPVDLNTAAQIVTEDGIETNIPPMKGLDQVHWVHAFPFPLKARSYRYLRRATYDEENDAFVIISKANPKGTFAEDAKSEVVEITEYYSCMVIRPLPGKSVSDLGLEYVLSYTDDQQIVLPRRFVTAATTDGIPRAIDQICCAAKVLFSSNKKACIDAKEEFSSDPNIRDKSASKDLPGFSKQTKSTEEVGNNPKRSFVDRHSNRNSPKKDEYVKMHKTSQSDLQKHSFLASETSATVDDCFNVKNEFIDGNKFQETLKLRLNVIYKQCYNFINKNKESLWSDETREDTFYLF